MAEFTRIRTIWTGVPGTPWFSNLYFEGGAATADAANAAVDTLMTSLAVIQSNQLAFTIEPTATILESTTGQPVDVTTTDGGTGVGGQAGDMVPRACQVLVRLDTGVFLEGRQVRGKFFLPGVGEAFNDGAGVPDADMLSGVLDTFTTLLEAPGNPQLVVWSRARATVQVVTSAAVWSEWALLRTRRD